MPTGNYAEYTKRVNEILPITVPFDDLLTTGGNLLDALQTVTVTVTTSVPTLLLDQDTSAYASIDLSLNSSASNLSYHWLTASGKRIVVYLSPVTLTTVTGIVPTSSIVVDSPHVHFNVQAGSDGQDYYILLSAVTQTSETYERTVLLHVRNT